MKVFIISHTHWDREWFLPSEYTNKWLKNLFENLFELLEKDKDFIFILDGQTLIVEDLLLECPEMKQKLERFIEDGQLLIGPVYGQIDWRISPEVAIWMNFSIGKRDVERFKGKRFCGWFMDNFGQFAQLPQILKAFDLDCAFIWRGVNFPDDKERIIFDWKAPDGSAVRVYFLLWGYRNLYNLSDTKEIKDERFRHEVEKERAFTDLAVLLDGYDLDIYPENPKEFFNVETSPYALLEEIRRKENVEAVEGEMISGKYTCVFPGTLSTRSYLKLGADHIGRLLRYLSIFEDDEKMWREYLKTLIHDNIAGVGVDQIHEKMEKVYQEINEKATKKLSEHFAKMNLKGLYVFMPNVNDYDFWYAEEKAAYHIKSDGAGIWKVSEKEEWKEWKGDLDFSNEYFEFHFDGESFWMDGLKIGEILVEKEFGDAYSSWTEPMSFDQKLFVEKAFKSKKALKITLKRIIVFESGKVETRETILLDESPIVRWNIEMRPRGVMYKIRFGSFSAGGEINAHMPFYMANRPEVDTDLLPIDLEGNLKNILLAAREVEKVKDFPFQGFVSKGDLMMLSLGLREYTAENGLWVTLIRSVEWITRRVRGRTGDAGPEMYVPGVRCERLHRFTIGFAKSNIERKWIEMFVNPPILFESHGKDTENIPMKFLKKDWIVVEDGNVVYLRENKIEKDEVRPIGLSGNEKASVKIVTDLSLPFGKDEMKPDLSVIEKMKEEIVEMEKEIKSLKETLKKLSGVEYHRAMHKILSLERSALEKKLSILLNEERLGIKRENEIERVGWELNHARRKRRTYDYILEFYESKEGDLS